MLNGEQPHPSRRPDMTRDGAHVHYMSQAQFHVTSASATLKINSR